MEKIQIFQDLIDHIQEKWQNGHLLLGDNVSVTNGSTVEHRILYHIKGIENRLYCNGTMRDIKERFSLVIPVIKFEKGYLKKMYEARHESDRTGCELVMATCEKEYKGKKQIPRLFKVNPNKFALSHPEINYDIINRDDFLNGADNADDIKKTFEYKMKELSNVY